MNKTMIKFSESGEYSPVMVFANDEEVSVISSVSTNIQRMWLIPEDTTIEFDGNVKEAKAGDLAILTYGNAFRSRDVYIISGEFAQMIKEDTIAFEQQPLNNELNNQDNPQTTGMA